MTILRSELTIGSLKLANRLVMPPMQTNSSEDNTVSEATLNYYGARSAGAHLGLIITEHLFVSKEGQASPRQLSISRDSDIEGLKRLVDLVHADGVPIIAQISHAGSGAKEETTGFQPISASPIPRTGAYGTPDIFPREMTQEDIDGVVAAFAAAAVRAQKAGFDGVELHSAHAYLLNQFYSPIGNKRTDAYGGDLNGRLKIHGEVIKAVREAVGPDYPVVVRLGGSDYTEGGSTVEDAVAAAVMFKEAGVDMIDISGGYNGFNVKGNDAPGWFSDVSGAIKAAVDVPVLLTGGIRTAEQAEELLQAGKTDLIGVGRPIFADAEYAQKMMAE